MLLNTVVIQEKLLFFHLILILFKIILLLFKMVNSGVIQDGTNSLLKKHQVYAPRLLESCKCLIQTIFDEFYSDHK